MLWDFGLEAKFFDDEEAVRRKIAEIESEFDLILIAERFDESMLLLRDFLCLNFEDVTYLKLNSRQKSAKSSLSDVARRNLASWLWADYALYDHFKAKFERRLRDYGDEDMKRDLRILNEANRNVKSKCGLKKSNNDNVAKNSEYKLWGKNMIGYTVDNNGDAFCNDYGISENAFIDELRRTQSRRFGNDDADFAAFQPAKMRLADGSPDIEAMAKRFKAL